MRETIPLEQTNDSESVLFIGLSSLSGSKQKYPDFSHPYLQQYSFSSQ
jgi:hypothetical protein